MDDTDDANELATLGGMLLGVASSTSGFHHLATQIRIGVDDALFYEILAGVRARLAELDRFIAGLPVSELPESMRKETQVAVQNFATLLSASHLAQPWNEHKARIVTELNFQSLRWFGSMVMRKRRPLRKISPEQIEEALARITAKIQEIEYADYLDWERPLLISGLQRIQTTLLYLQFFGHERAIADIFATVLQTQVLYDAVSDSDPRASKKKTSMAEWLGIAGFIMTLFIFPDQGVTAIERYQTWVTEYVVSHTPGPQHKLLEGPSRVAKESEAPEVEETEQAASE